MIENFKTIPLTKGKVTLVDEDLYEFLNQYEWMCNDKGYACRSMVNREGKKEFIFMHNVILGKGTGDGFYCDHINGIPLDNRRCNLRLASKTENMQNISRRRNKTTSRFKGVFKRKDSGKFRVIIMANGTRVNVGQFEDEVTAARAYNEAANRLHGEFACLNDLEFSNEMTGASKRIGE